MNIDWQKVGLQLWHKFAWPDRFGLQKHNEAVLIYLTICFENECQEEIKECRLGLEEHNRQYANDEEGWHKLRRITTAICYNFKCRAEPFMYEIHRRALFCLLPYILGVDDYDRSMDEWAKLPCFADLVLDFPVPPCIMLTQAYRRCGKSTTILIMVTALLVACPGIEIILVSNRAPSMIDNAKRIKNMIRALDDRVRVLYSMRYQSIMREHNMHRVCVQFEGKDPSILHCILNSENIGRNDTFSFFIVVLFCSTNLDRRWKVMFACIVNTLL